MPNSKATLLVTGGTGFIGSHATCLFLEAGYEVVVLDNLCNSDQAVIKRIETITGKVPVFVQADVRDHAALRGIFSHHRIGAVVHFAGLKAVGESVLEPLRYYDNNVGGTLILLEEMLAAGVKRMVFSSSATVYGDPADVPVSETCPCAPANPYGRNKLMIEEILQDVAQSDSDWRVACLRYFNPVGAHPSGMLGEAPTGRPNNLMPFIAQVAAGMRSHLDVFGNDYPTPDGTGMRDYIHVMDLVAGHLVALQRLEAAPGTITVNLGAGRGVSVLEMIAAFETAVGKPINYRFAPRREGDVPRYWADPALALQILGWKTTRSIDDMCGDTWRWMNYWRSISPGAGNV